VNTLKLEHGLFIEISGCFPFPCNFTRLSEFFKQKCIKIDVDKIKYYKCRQSEISYKNMIDGMYDDFTSNVLCDIEFSNNTIMSADIIVNNCCAGGISTVFYDDISYVLSVLLSEDDFETKKFDDNFVKGIAETFFKTLRPMYGRIAVADSVLGMKSLISGDELLPIKHAFLSTEIYQVAEEKLKLFLKNNDCKDICPKYLDKAGVFFDSKNDNHNDYVLDISKYVVDALGNFIN